MERFCSKCGSLVEGEGKFCPNCGGEIESAVNLDKAERVTPVMSAAQPVNTQPAGYSSRDGYTDISSAAQMPAQSGVSPAKPGTMTLGQWVGTILLTTMLGLVSIVLLFVWGFGSDTPETKKRYCRAMLIIYAIGVGAAIVFSIIGAIGTAVTAGSITSGISYY